MASPQEIHVAAEKVRKALRSYKLAAQAINETLIAHGQMPQHIANLSDEVMDAFEAVGELEHHANRK